jgi:hypothetical protein
MHIVGTGRRGHGVAGMDMRTRVVSFAIAATLSFAGTAAAEIGFPECRDDRDCIGALGGPICDGFACTSCTADEQCPPDAVCERGACVVHCDDDLECHDPQPWCDGVVGTCVQCRSDEDCGMSEFCQGGWCVQDLCDAGRLYCSHDGTGIRTCAPNGAGLGDALPCDDGTVCVASRNDAACVAPADPDTGSSSSTTTDAASTSDTGVDMTPSASTGMPVGDGISSDDDEGGVAELADRGCGCRASGDAWQWCLVLAPLLWRRRAVRLATGGHRTAP